MLLPHNCTVHTKYKQQTDLHAGEEHGLSRRSTSKDSTKTSVQTSSTLRGQRLCKAIKESFVDHAFTSSSALHVSKCVYVTKCGVERSEGACDAEGRRWGGVGGSVCSTET